MSRRAAVIVASTRVHAGTAEDRTGPVIASWLSDHAFAHDGVTVVPDGPEVGAALRRALESGVDLVITTGGTGIGPADVTPEQTRPLLDIELPGLEEEIRRRGLAWTPSAVLSRGRAGLAGRTLVVNLPGSPGGVRDGLAVLDGLIDHALDQIAGGGHG